jgi:hypothetical protein
MENTKKKFIS